jgi:UrcA family protein
MTVPTSASNRYRIGRIAVLTASLLAGAFGVAHAAAPLDEVPTVVVHYGDLDLSTQDGARALYKRISYAAAKVCPSEDSRDLARYAHAQACREEAIARAVREINSPQLAALRDAHTKRG